MSIVRCSVLAALLTSAGVVAGCTPSDPTPVGGSGGTSGAAGTGGSGGAGGSGGVGMTTGGSGGTSGGAGGSGGGPGSGGGQGMDAGVDTNHSDTNVADRPADVSPAVDGGTVLPAAPKLAADIAPFIKTKCAASGCHDPIKKEHGMDMSTGPTIYAAWVNKMTADHCANDAPVTRVIPSRPADSFVLKMVENVGRCAEMPRMPPAPRAALTAAEIKAVRDWITAGAMND